MTRWKLGLSALRSLTLGPSPQVEREGPKREDVDLSFSPSPTPWRGGQGVRLRRADRPEGRGRGEDPHFFISPLTPGPTPDADRRSDRRDFPIRPKSGSGRR